VFEFSRRPAAEVGFRSQMSERVLRQYEASGSETSVRKLSISQLRIQLRPVDERSVTVKRTSVSVEFSSVRVKVSGPPPVGSMLVSEPSRLFASLKFASRECELKRVLVTLTAKSKRTASLNVFQRMRERFARLSPSRVPRSPCSSASSLRASPAPRSRAYVASRIQ
jgi:hypothetical protein